ncbi:GrpB family protein [Methylobacterium trifolii]|uniref:GrpB family protein n=1 Tax=Methylobacterium trifolii TaxID=1003092 RepID=A0ABQ4TWX4_9HYPH|nr:GrpB family protein [Methylobacterium trifolii]GJE59193.1 hypothetical protein MPOCJGCO_1281 [Methylobacterium trifolii]
MSDAATLILIDDPDASAAAAEALFQAVAAALRPALPGTARIEHVGATAIPGCLTKGDLDIAVRIPADDFEACRAVLAARYLGNAGSVRTADFAAFADEAVEPPLGIQLVAIGTAFDVFTRFRDRLRDEPALLAAYNALKLRHAGTAMADYRTAKDAFVADVLRSGTS